MFTLLNYYSIKRACAWLILSNYIFTLFIVTFPNTLSAALMNLAFPQRSPGLALALMPPPSFLRAPVDLATLCTQVYYLSSRETTTSVAKIYNMSYESLRKLNQFRTFACSFKHLQPGDEDVPLAPLPEQCNGIMPMVSSNHHRRIMHRHKHSPQWPRRRGNF